MSSAGFFSGFLGEIGDNITKQKEQAHKEEMSQHKMEMELYKSALENPNLNPAMISYLTQKYEEMIPGAAGTKSTRPGGKGKGKGGKKGGGGMLTGLVTGLQQMMGKDNQQAPTSSSGPLPANTLLSPEQQDARKMSTFRQQEKIRTDENIRREQEKFKTEKDEPVGTPYVTAKDASKPWMGFNRVTKTKGGGTSVLDENAYPTGILGEQYFQSQALRQIDPSLSPEAAWNKVQENYRRTQTLGKTFSSKADEIHSIHPDWNDAQVARELAKQAKEQTDLKNENIRSVISGRNLSNQTKQLLLGDKVQGMTPGQLREFNTRTLIDRQLITTLMGKRKSGLELEGDEQSALDTAITKVQAERDRILGKSKGGASLPPAIAAQIQEGHRATLSDGSVWQKTNGQVNQVSPGK